MASLPPGSGSGWSPFACSLLKQSLLDLGFAGPRCRSLLLTHHFAGPAILALVVTTVTTGFACLLINPLLFGPSAEGGALL